MSVYYFATFITGLLAYISSHAIQFEKWKKILIFVSGLPLFLVSALRYNVGTDYLSYRYLFTAINTGMRYREIEPIYLLLNKIVYWLGGNSQWVFAVCAAIIVYLIAISSFDESSSPGFSLVLFVLTNYYFYSLNAVRQMTGMAFLVFSIRYIRKRELFKFSIFVFIAAGFHSSCLVFLIAYLLPKVDISLVTIIVVTILIVILRTPMQQAIIRIVENTKYAHYVNLTDSETSIAIITLSISAIIVALAMIFDDKGEKYKVYYNMEIISLWLAILGNVVPWMHRIQRIFELPVIIFLPLIVDKIENPYLRAGAKICIISCYAVLCYYRIAILGYQDCLPYQTVFNYNSITS